MATLAIAFTVLIHTLAVPVMIWAVRGDEGLKGIFDWIPRDEPGGDGGSKLPDAPDAPEPGGGEALPLTTSEFARTRLREHGDRVADPARRPVRRARPATPAPAPVPQRTRR